MKKILLLLVSLSFAIEVLAQAPIGELTYNKVTNNKDTVIIQRRYGNWWFGPSIGLNRNYYFGNLNYSTNNDPGNPFKKNISFDLGDGGGLMLGGIIEYLPVNQKFGYGMNMYFIENRSVSATSQPMTDTFQTYFDFSSQLSYLVISPFVRYNFLLPGLFTYSGIDVAINTSQETKFKKNFVNSGTIEQWQNNPLNDLPVSIGFHIGLGYDFFLADISEKARTRLTPFVSLNMNSSMISDNNSTWSGLQLKLGFALKLGFDDIEYDTLYYDENQIIPPVYLAAANIGPGVEFSGFRSHQSFVSADLAYIEKNIEPPNNDLVSNNGAQTNLTTKEDNIANIRYNFNTPYRYRYSGSNSTDLTNDIRNNIDNMANYLKSNPNVKVIIIGYSDNAGTFVQNDTRSRLRAQKVEQEFIRKGINKNRITVTWRGSLGNIAPNTTEEGRLQNRRVEISFVR